MDQTDHMLVLTTLPDRESGLRVAGQLLEERLVACASVGAEMTSVYRWRGETHTDPEVQLTLKTRRDRWNELEKRVLELHPYEEPELLALPVTGNRTYLRWMDECVAQTLP